MFFVNHFLSNSYLCRTDPADVCRVEAKTFICTDEKYDTVAHVKEGVKGILAQWKSPKDMQVELKKRFPDCMKGWCNCGCIFFKLQEKNQIT